VKKKIKQIFYKLRGSPTQKWMVCLGALGCKGMKPYPMLCNFRWDKLSWNYDFFSLYGPFNNEQEAQTVCNDLLKED